MLTRSALGEHGQRGEKKNERRVIVPALKAVETPGFGAGDDVQCFVVGQRLRAHEPKALADEEQEQQRGNDSADGGGGCEIRANLRGQRGDSAQCERLRDSSVGIGIGRGTDSREAVSTGFDLRITEDL